MIEPNYVAAVQLTLHWDPELSSRACGAWFTRALDRLAQAGGDLLTLQVIGTSSQVILTARLRDQSEESVAKAAEFAHGIMIIDAA